MKQICFLPYNLTGQSFEPGNDKECTRINLARTGPFPRRLSETSTIKYNEYNKMLLLVIEKERKN